jgi:hypothetical protein
MSTNKLTSGLLKTRRSLTEVCAEFGIPVPASQDLEVDQCTQCSTWHYTYSLVEDLDGNSICTYCDNIFGR